MDIVDDPTAKEWNGRPLFGNFLVDLDGVVPAPLTIVEKGMLRNMLATRQPVKGRAESNGRARLFANFGANGPAFGNLIVRAAGTSTLAELKQKLIDLVRQGGKPYGLLIRKMDFPSTASGSELQRIAARMAQDGGAARAVSLPILAYRSTPTAGRNWCAECGSKESAIRSLRDIVAAGEPAVYDYLLENGATFACRERAPSWPERSVVAPGLLFEELQLTRAQDELTSSRSSLPGLRPPAAKHGPAESNHLPARPFRHRARTPLFTFVLFLRSVGQLFELMVQQLGDLRHDSLPVRRSCCRRY